MKSFSIVRNLVISFTLAASAALHAAEEKTEDAVKAAKSWLAIVDAKDYKKSWSEAATFFQEKVAEEQWAKLVESVRKPLGEVKSRELIGTKLEENLPGAPKGEYVIIQFKTNFADKPESVETVTPMKDEKGVWKVSGYFIK